MKMLLSDLTENQAEVQQSFSATSRTGSKVYTKIRRMSSPSEAEYTGKSLNPDPIVIIMYRSQKSEIETSLYG